jgi:surface carbohydrate biosynthesis protein
VWRKPPRAVLLIIDRGTASPLDEMFAHHKPHVLDIRGESINMRALLRAVPKIRLGALAYIEAYIDFVKPKLILSRTDNNPTMWQLKRRKNATYQVALVQNGLRTRHAKSSVKKVLGDNGKSQNLADKYFVFGSAAAHFLETRVQADFEHCGNTVLNELDIFFNRESKNIDRGSLSDVALISTFRSKETELHETQRNIYRSLDEYLAKTSYELLIIGNGGSKIEKELETQFFNEIFQKAKFRIGFFRVSGESYQHLIMNRWILSGHSTLGYETLVTGVPIGFVLPTAKIFDGRDFDATSNLGSSGLFWSRSDDPQEHNRIFTYLDTVSDEQWEHDSGWIRDQLMVYDYGNTKIRTYVEGVLADSLESNSVKK